MLRTVNWLARGLGFAWLGLLAFLLAPAHQPGAVAVQAAGYCLLGVALLAWALLEMNPLAARQHHRALTVLRGVIAVASGFAAGAGYGGTAMVAFGFVAAMMAGSDESLAVALALTGAGVLAIEISGLALDSGYGVLLGLPPIVLAGLVVGRNRGAYRIQAEQAAQLLAQREDLEAEQRRADLLDERTRIAREIHDVLAHSLGALGIQLQAVQAVLGEQGDTGRALSLLGQAQRMAKDGLAETRRAVHALRADTAGLDEQLTALIDAHRSRHHAAVSFRIGGQPRPLPPEATLALTRTAQEALVNTAKHAPLQPVELGLHYGEGGVQMIISNPLPPGTPGNPVPGTAFGTVNGGYGLTGMRERLLLIGGSLTAAPGDGRWTVTAQVPR